MSQKEFNWDGATINNISILPASERISIEILIPMTEEPGLTMIEAAALIDKARFNVWLVDVSEGGGHVG